MNVGRETTIRGDQYDAHRIVRHVCALPCRGGVVRRSFQFVLVDSAINDEGLMVTASLATTDSLVLAHTIVRS